VVVALLFSIHIMYSILSVMFYSSAGTIFCGEKESQIGFLKFNILILYK